MEASAVKTEDKPVMVPGQEIERKTQDQACQVDGILGKSLVSSTIDNTAKGFTLSTML